MCYTAVNPVLVWTLLALGGLAYAGFTVMLQIRKGKVKKVLTNSGKWEDSEKSFAEWFLFHESKGNSWYSRLGRYVSDTRVLVVAPAAIAIASLLVVWLLVIRFGTVLYLPFMALVVFLLFNRPFDALESYSIAGRFVSPGTPKFNRSDWVLLAQAYSLISKGRWFYLLIGSWLATFAAIDYRFGTAIALWLPAHSGSWGALLLPEQWHLLIYLVVLGLTSVSSLVLWRGRRLDFAQADAKEVASTLSSNEELRRTYQALFPRALK